MKKAKGVWKIDTRSETSRIEQTLSETLENRDFTQQKSLWTYLRTSLHRNSLWGLWRRGLDWFRRFRLVAFLIRALTVVWTVLQTGATVILSTLLFLVALPLTVSLLLGILLTAILETSSSNRRLYAATEGKRVYVTFLSRTESAFFAANVHALARKGQAVIVVSPYWISWKGLRKGNFYCTARREAEGVYLVRRFYFLALKRRVLSQRETAYLY